jgi:uncharacterized protein with PQ loop repeat
MKYFIIALIGVGLVLLFGCQDNIVNPKTELDYSLKQLNKGESVTFGQYEGSYVNIKFGGVVLYFDHSMNIIINNKLLKYDSPIIKININKVIYSFEIKFLSIDASGLNDVVSIQLLSIKV